MITVDGVPVPLAIERQGNAAVQEFVKQHVESQKAPAKPQKNTRGGESR